MKVIIPFIFICLIAGCGQSSPKTEVLIDNSKPSLSGRALSAAPFNFKIQNNLVQITTDQDTGGPPKNLNVNVFCADSRDGKLVNKVNSPSIWRKKQLQITVKMPTSIAKKQACGFTFGENTDITPGQSAIAFFDKKESEAYAKRENTKLKEALQQGRINP